MLFTAIPYKNTLGQFAYPYTHRPLRQDNQGERDLSRYTLSESSASPTPLAIAWAYFRTRLVPAI
jgi:hypothetical protein